MKRIHRPTTVREQMLANLIFALCEAPAHKLGSTVSEAMEFLEMNGIKQGVVGPGTRFDKSNEQTAAQSLARSDVLLRIASEVGATTNTVAVSGRPIGVSFTFEQLMQFVDRIDDTVLIDSTDTSRDAGRYRWLRRSLSWFQWSKEYKTMVVVVAPKDWQLRDPFVGSEIVDGMFDEMEQATAVPLAAKP